MKKYGKKKLKITTLVSNDKCFNAHPKILCMQTRQKKGAKKSRVTSPAKNVFVFDYFVQVNALKNHFQRVVGHFQHRILENKHARTIVTNVELLQKRNYFCVFSVFFAFFFSTSTKKKVVTIKSNLNFLVKSFFQTITQENKSLLVFF